MMNQFIKCLISFFFLSFVSLAFSQNNIVSQTVTIKGVLMDTAQKRNLQNVLVIASKFSDSTIAGYARSNSSGMFEIKLPIDTYMVSFHHPDYGEKFIFILANDKNLYFDFGTLQLPPKEFQLDEIVIYADREPVYYKGDTLVYIADSFKVKPDATVEDLLKKLPGIQVDKSGKIKVQGKDVDKVLVDGDEFFGTDPTIATKNLQAKQVENIQVYEQKNQETGDNADKEMLQIMNIQLKDEAKKGYFGKIYGGSDGKKFYETQILFNRFRDKQKISLFGMSGNTPGFNLSWTDMDKYGLDNEYDFFEEDDGMFRYYDNSDAGIPQISKGGAYYNNKWNKAKLNANYSVYQNILTVQQSEYSQYFLNDSTYYSDKTSQSKQQNDIHKLNFSLNWDADSLNSFEISNRTSYSLGKKSYSETTNFSNRNFHTFRRTDINNAYSEDAIQSNSTIRYNRYFHKKDREFILTYSLKYEHNTSLGNLNADNTYYNPMPSLPNFNQQKNKILEVYHHKTTVKYTEPLNKFFKIILNYDYRFSAGTSEWKTFNPNTQNDYVILDSTFSNIFHPAYFQHIPECGINFNKSKMVVSAGVKYRYFDIKNQDLFNQKYIHYNVDNWLPYFKFNYKINKTTNLSTTYNLQSDVPNLPQLQPVQNNNNPNNIVIGNPSLLPTIEHKFRMTLYSYRPVSGDYFWCSGDYRYKERDFSNSIVYDNYGRSISQAVNSYFNYSSNVYAGMNLNFFKKLLLLDIFYSYYISKNQNFINQQKNNTSSQFHSISISPKLNVEEEKYSVEFSFNGGYSYNIPYATLNNTTNQPYQSYSYGTSLNIYLLERYSLETSLDYTTYQNYAPGYNPNPLIWNASAGLKAGKKKNLKISFLANDILNQNVNIRREIYNNVITDRKINIIRRYFLLQITYNFNNQGKTEEDEE